MMKTIEIDIDNTSSLQKLENELGMKNLQKGDRLIIMASQLNDNELIGLSIVIVILAVIHKRFNDDYSDRLLRTIFQNQSIQDIERELRNEYNIELVIDSKEDYERRKWQQFSQSKLIKAYDYEEPEYSDSMVKEPNPEYKK